MKAFSCIKNRELITNHLMHFKHRSLCQLSKAAAVSFTPPLPRCRGFTSPSIHRQNIQSIAAEEYIDLFRWAHRHTARPPPPTALFSHPVPSLLSPRLCLFPAADSDSEEADETLLSWIQVPAGAVCRRWEPCTRTATAYDLTQATLLLFCSEAVFYSHRPPQHAHTHNKNRIPTKSVLI